MQMLVMGGCSVDRCNSRTPASAYSYRIDLGPERRNWTREEMPAPRVMPYSTLLPDGTVFVANGGATGGASSSHTRLLSSEFHSTAAPIKSRAGLGCPVAQELDAPPLQTPLMHCLQTPDRGCLSRRPVFGCPLEDETAKLWNRMSQSHRACLLC